MFWKKKKKAEEPKAEIQVELKTPEPEKKPKETTRSAIMQIYLVNNKTDKEYIIKSRNDFGLTWDYIDVKDTGFRLLSIQQKKDVDGNKWQAIARLLDFSIVDVIWANFDIVSSSEN